MNMFVFSIDGFRIIQLAVTLAVFGLSSLFSLEYFKFDFKKIKKFSLITLVVFISVIGIFLSESLLTLFVFFELMSFSSYLWVAFNNDNESREASKVYFAVSLITGMISLMGILMVSNQIGTMLISDVYEMSNAVQDKTILFVGASLAIVGFCAKACFYPLHIWLAKSYTSAPAPATAMLSAVLSKAGVFGVIIVSSNIFTHNEEYSKYMVIISLITMLWGGICAIKSDDMKTIMAYSSMSQLGFVFISIAMQGYLGEENAIAVNGTVLHMLNHSVFKLIMFTLCGICFVKFGSTKLADIKGVARKNKLFAFAFVTAGAGLAGVPFFSGFISKTLIHESIVEKYHLSHNMLFSGVEVVFMLCGALTACYVFKIALTVFGYTKDETKFKLSLISKICLLIPSLFVIAMGSFPNLIADEIANFGSSIMHGGHLEHAIEYFNYINLKSAVISVFGGMVIYFIVFMLVMKEISVPVEVPKFLYIEQIFKFIYKGIMFVFKIYTFITVNLLQGLINKMIAFCNKPAYERDITITPSVSYYLGEKLDKFFSLFKFKPKHESYANDFKDFEKKSALRRRMITSSLSYGLMLSGVGLIGVLVYLLIA